MGTSLGISITLAMLPFVEMAINYLHEGFDVGLWLSSLTCTLGALLGAYLGYRLAFVILIASQAFLSAYLFVRGISLVVGGFPDEIAILKDMFDLQEPDEQVRPDLPFLLYGFSIVVLAMMSFKLQIRWIYGKKLGGDHQRMVEEEEIV